MKETTYGWYPAARDIVKAQGGRVPTDSYNQECLYKHSKSRYADKPGIQTPEDPLNSYRWQPTPQQVRKYKSVYRSASPTHSTQDKVRSKPMINLEIRGQSPSRVSPANNTNHDITQVDKTESMHNVSMSPDVNIFAPSHHSAQKTKYGKDCHPHPVKAWDMKTTETSIPNFQEYLKQSSQQQQDRLTPHLPSTAQGRDGTPSTQKYTYLRRSLPVTPTQNTATPTSVGHKERIKSATTYRPHVDAPRRSVMSAGPSRFSPVYKTVTPDIEEDNISIEKDKDEIEREDDKDDTYSFTSINADETYPVEPAFLEHPVDVTCEPGKQELGVDFPVDYDEQLKKYGWRAQVHGDPLYLKRPCLAKRFSFTTELPVPTIPPDAPKSWKENIETFFLNTIPRKPMSFTIHQEWPSEVLHAKRMELQKRDGGIFKYKRTNYTFAY